MRIPNFLYEQYVSNSIFNTAMTELLDSIIQTGGNSIFLIPGVINPQYLQFTFNGSPSGLIVNVNVGNGGAFQCLFNTGNICTGHGIINGIDLPTYTVNLSSFVPATGSQVVYIVAQYTQVQEDNTTIIGPPPGHPDYSPNFNPYIGYTVLQDTLNIIPTTTIPDNLVNIELARVTLVAGQSTIIAVDTSFQILARVNAEFVAMSGDVVGNSNSNVIASWQGNPIALRTPGINNIPQWNGATWAPTATPTTLPPSGPAGGDLAGTYPNPQVAQSTVNEFIANNIGVLGNLIVNNNIAANSLDINTTIAAGGAITSNNNITAAGGMVAGIFGTIFTGVLTLGQFSFGQNSNGYYFTVPVWTGSAHLVLYIQFGNVPYAFPGVPGHSTQTFSFPIAFPTTPLIVTGNFGSVLTNNIYTCGLEALNNSQYNVTNTDGGAHGIFFIAIGY